MNRRKAREYALQMLFRQDFVTAASAVSPDNFWTDKKEKKGVIEFAEHLVQGTVRNLEAIDVAIQRAAENWDLDRMAAVDRNILRFAVFEVLYNRDIPSAVTINEALEIAKKYSASESVAFINGLLDKIARETGKA